MICDSTTTSTSTTTTTTTTTSTTHSKVGVGCILNSPFSLEYLRYILAVIPGY